MQSSWIIIFITIVLIVMHGYAQNLKVSVVSTRSSFGAENIVEVTLNYKNKGPNIVLIYPWYLPNKELFHPLFDITRDGKTVKYVGPLIKRRAPTAADMIALKPGEERNAIVPLSLVYNMTEQGTYVVEFSRNIAPMLHISARDFDNKDAQSTYIDESNLESIPGKLFAVGRRNALIDESVKFKSEPRATTYTFLGCSTIQQNSIVAGLKSAKSYSTAAVTYLNTLTSASNRYTTWFGKYSLSNLVTVRTDFTNIEAVFNSKPITFDCRCNDEGTYAYVYPDQTYKIYLCPEFWPSSTTGTDSKGGTLIHETSHFTIVAGTDDYAYGQIDCKALARSSVTRAIRNADSHQYFAENNPVLA